MTDPHDPREFRPLVKFAPDGTVAATTMIATTAPLPTDAVYADVAHLDAATVDTLTVDPETVKAVMEARQTHTDALTAVEQAAQAVATAEAMVSRAMNVSAAKLAAQTISVSGVRTP